MISYQNNVRKYRTREHEQVFGFAILIVMWKDLNENPFFSKTNISNLLVEVTVIFLKNSVVICFSACNSMWVKYLGQLPSAYCFVHPILLSFGFWCCISCVFIFLFVFLTGPSCLARCKQKLRNVFVFSYLCRLKWPKTKNEKWDERNIFREKDK